MIRKRPILLFVSLILTIGILFQSVVIAEEKRNILVLGDSVSTGYRLSDPKKESFTSLLSVEEGYTICNKAVNGNTVSDIINQLSTGAITESELKAADVVTITCGGNDLMFILYQKLCEIWNESHPDDLLTVEEIPSEMANPESARRLSLLFSTLRLLDSTNELYLMDDKEFSDAVIAFSDGLKNIVQRVSSCNPDAKIIVTTQYNPYKGFQGKSLMNYISLDSVYSGMEAGVTLLNRAITENAFGYTVADVKSAFDLYSGTEPLYYASPDTMEVDFHPTKSGHRVIADVLKTVILEVTEQKTPEEGAAFVDVIYHWAKEDIAFMVSKGWMNGTGEETFTPDGKLTRGMLITVLYRMEGEPPVNRSIPFSDVSLDAYYLNAVSWAKQNGIVNGVTEEEFAPNLHITREQIATVLYRYLSQKGYHMADTEENTLSSYRDFKAVSPYAIKAMEYAVENGIITGKSADTLHPGDYATRAELCAMLHRLWNLYS